MPSNLSERARRRGRRRVELPLVEIPIKLKLRAGQHDDVIDFFRSIPAGSRAATIVQLARACLSGEVPGLLPRPTVGLEPTAEEEIYAALKDLL